MKLKTHILKTNNVGLDKDKTHLTKELKETRTLYRNYEDKCAHIMNQFESTNTEY